MIEHECYGYETFTVSEDTKIPGTNYIIKKGESFTFVDESEQMTEENTIYCDGQEAKTLNVLQQLFGNSDLVFRGKHIWKFSSDKSHEDALKRLNDYEKEHNLDLEYSSESVLHEDYDDHEYSRHQNKNEFWFANKQICEDKKVSNISIEIEKECKIPGTDIVLEAGDTLEVMEQ